MDDATSGKSAMERFFSVLQAKRESFADFMRLYEPTLAPRFNLFDFIGPNENKLSEIIAFFLDPKETHGQGYLFLGIFLDLIGRSEIFGSMCDGKGFRSPKCILVKMDAGTDL